MSFYQRMILSMLAVLLLFALVNGLLVYTMIKNSDSESLVQFNKVLRENEEHSINTWLSFARSAIYPYVALSNKYPDSTDFYKNAVLVFLRETNWSISPKHYGFYSIFDAKTGNSIIFRDTLGNILPQSEKVLEIEDINGKKFAKEIMEKAYVNDDSYITFTYSKQCISCLPTEKIAKGIYIEDWGWVVFTGSYTDKLIDASKHFSEKFKNSRLTLMGNLLGIMLISFLIGLFMVFRQMNSFVIPLRNLSDYIHRLANEGIHFEDISISAKLQAELRSLVEDLNSLIHNVGTLIENVRISADRVSDLSGACTDMLDIVDYDAKLVGQRTAEMAVSSKDVIENVSSMATGIEEININLDGLKRLTSHVAENSTDIKSSFFQISEAMKELNEKSRFVQNNAISVTQSVNDIEIASTEELGMVNNISEVTVELHGGFEKMAERIGELRKYTTHDVHLIIKAIQKPDADKEKSLDVINSICGIVDKLHEEIMSTKIQFINLQKNQIFPLAHVVENRKNLSKEISADSLELKISLISMVARIAEINSNLQYINSNIKRISNDINESYRKVDEVGVATDTMNEHAKQVRARMDEFSLKSKRVEEAHSAIEHTLIDAKDSMKSLNDLSANLRKVVDDLVRLDNKQKIEVIQF